MNLRTLIPAILGAALAGACAGTVEEFKYPVTPSSAKGTPPGWEKVALASVTAAPVLFGHLGAPPEETLGRVLEARLGTGGARSIVLAVENVRASETGEGRAGMQIGLAADFVLSGAGKELRIRLEHSINFFELDDQEKRLVYSRLVDDLCDRLFYHPKALAYLEKSGVERQDSAMSAREMELGPVLPTRPSQPEVEATGRILWGHRESSLFGVAQLALGDLTSFFGVMRSRSRNTETGLGWRYGFGLGGAHSGGDSASGGGGTTFFGLMYHLAVEIGISSTVHSDAGYVDRPGISLIAVPQLDLQQFFAFGSEGGNIQLYLGTMGISPELDLPLGRSFGITGGAFFGGSLVTINTPSTTIGGTTIGGSTTSGSFLWYPFGDIYYQTASGRISLGLAFQQLVGALGGGGGGGEEEGGSIFKNPKFIFTYEDRFGRGVAYKKESFEAAGFDLHNDVKVLSSPRSAFYNDEGRPITLAGASMSGGTGRAWRPASAPSIVSAPVTAPPPPVVSAAGRGDAGRMGSGAPVEAPAAAVRASAPSPEMEGRWLIFPTDVDQTLGSTTASAVTRVIQQALTDRGRSLIPSRDVDVTLSALGGGPFAEAAFRDVAGAFAAQHTIQAAVALSDDRVHFRLSHFLASKDNTRVVEGETTRIAMLRVLREKVIEILDGVP